MSNQKNDKEKDAVASAVDAIVILPEQKGFEFKSSLCNSCRYCNFLKPVEQDPFFSSWCANHEFDEYRGKSEKEALENVPDDVYECEYYLSRNVEVRNGIPVTAEAK